MSSDANEPGRDRVPDQSEARIARRLARIQRVTLLGGLGLVLVGSTLEFVHRGHIGSAAVALTDLPSGLVGLHGGAVLTLGLLVLLIAPASGIAYLVGALFKASDRLHALLAAVVLAILIASILFKGNL